MDINLPVTKYQRYYEFLKAGDGVDRISKLPDEILAHILSYLSTKEAVATSILSKRWEYLWTLTPDLDFTFSLPYMSEKDYTIRCRSFKEYVDRVIFYHSGSIIRNCSMLFASSNISPHIYAWICAVITCNLQNLTLTNPSFTFQDLPWRLFTCKTLVVLKIDGSFVLDLPIYVSLPCLKVLWLAGVVYVDDDSVHRLFSSCPVLEDLAIKRNDWDGVRIMNISIPSLKRLSIRSNVYHFGYRYSTNINTPCLEYLGLRCNTWEDYSMNLACSLAEARISYGFSFSLLNGISKVKHLILTGDVMTGLHRSFHDHAFPIFHNLKKMELYVGKPVDWDLLPNLLECSPNLEVLVFPEGLVAPKGSGRGFYRFYWHRPESVPECLLLHLKTIEIFNFVGLPGELYLVAYLLECGEVLDKMIIYGYDYSTRPRMRKKMEGVKYAVLNFERSSDSCEVVFTY